MFIPFNAVLMESNFGVTASKMKISVFFRKRAWGGRKLNIFLGREKSFYNLYFYLAGIFQQKEQKGYFNKKN